MLGTVIRHRSYKVWVLLTPRVASAAGSRTGEIGSVAETRDDGTRPSGREGAGCGRRNPVDTAAQFEGLPGQGGASARD
ncbi:MAG: hypothetical protein NVSMB13_18560 [Mycobacteriales bacterium]